MPKFEYFRQSIGSSRAKSSRRSFKRELIFQYDDDVINGLRANAQAYLVNTLADLVPEEVREDVEILDVAAGTGIVGELLAKIGFKKFDACG